MTIVGRLTAATGAAGAAVLLALGTPAAADMPDGKTAEAAAPERTRPEKPMPLTRSPISKNADRAPAKKAAAAEKKSPRKKDDPPRPARKPDMKSGAIKIPAATATRTGRPSDWGYRGDTGPAHWGGLNKAYRTCGAGRSQSPVNLEAVEAGRMPALEFRYKVSLISMLNDGHVVRADYGKGSHILLGDERYDLVGFQFRTPSEHTVAGRSFPMEIQFVHRHKDGRIAMIGLLATTGPANLAARELWDRLPSKAHTRSKDTRALMNARDLLPESTAYFRYRGSLTMPPCTENVDWLILRAAVSFSENQIARLRGITGENARPVQARNGRYLLQATGG